MVPTMQGDRQKMRHGLFLFLITPAHYWMHLCAWLVGVEFQTWTTEEEEETDPK